MGARLRYNATPESRILRGICKVVGHVEAVVLKQVALERRAMDLNIELEENTVNCPSLLIFVEVGR